MDKKKTTKKERLGFNLVLLGMITSGKNTQADILGKKYDLQFVESGKHWRKKLKEDSPDGELLRRTTGKGWATPVKLMKVFLKDSLDKKKKNKDLLFVGNPRLKPEAQLLNKLFKERKEDYYAMYITLPEKEVYKRTLGRKSGNAKAIYKNLDKEHLIPNRIKWHKEQVSKAVAYFKSIDKMKMINGKQSIPKVNQDIEKAINEFKKRNKKYHENISHRN